jgi:hypothetical protein
MHPYRPALALLPFILLSACSSSHPRPDPHTITVTTTNTSLAGRTTLGMPIALRGRSTVVIPFAIESEKDLFQTRDPYSAGRWSASPVGTFSNSLGLTTTLSEGDYASSIPGGGVVRWHNAILHDLSSGEEWPILDTRGVISSWTVFNVRGPGIDDHYQAHAIVFLATIADTNHDGLLNDLDARVAILTDGDGRHPRIVTPADAQVSSVAYDAERDQVFLMVIADTNHDRVFDFNDAPVPYLVKANGAAATPVVSPEMLRRVESLLK